VTVVGAGAFGVKHLEVLSRIEGVEVAAIASRTLQQAREVATRFNVDVATDNFTDVIAMSDVDAVILCSPTPLHAEHAEAALRRGKHVQIEIPLADDWASAQRVADVARDSGLVCMVGHTRRFNPSHQWVRHRILDGELSLLHLQA
jgi:2-hydroxy-4-carboxymuconate semialdehyde hemiacetal dehydrogenase